MQQLSLGQVGLALLLGQDGLDVVVVQTQILQVRERHLCVCVLSQPSGGPASSCGDGPYRDVGQIDEAGERGEVVVVQFHSTQVEEEVSWTQIHYPAHRVRK